VTVPDAAHPGRVIAQLMVPLTCVGDWNVPEIELLAKLLPVIGIEYPAADVTVSPVGQFAARFGKLML
jgi:hypothetical protein